MAVIQQHITEKYALYNGDCIEGMSDMPEGALDFSIYSPPFCGLYQYSSDLRDLSNSRNYDEFMEHYDLVISQIFRLTKPGRCSAVHVMDIPDSCNLGNHLTDFPGDVIRAHVMCRNPKCDAGLREKMRGDCGHGWFDYIARHHIWKEPLGVRNRTMAKGLAHRTCVEDSTLCDVAGADYLLMFRRKGKNQVPVTHDRGLMEYYGEEPLPADCLQYRGWSGKQTENKYSHNIWRRYASSCWHDVRIGNVLPYKEARDTEDEKHVHPLQLDVIARAIELRSNPGEVVGTPFMGVGSEVYQAVAMGRKAVGWELKSTYYAQSVKNCDSITQSAQQNSFFEQLTES